MPELTQAEVRNMLAINDDADLRSELERFVGIEEPRPAGWIVVDRGTEGCAALDKPYLRSWYPIDWTDDATEAHRYAVRGGAVATAAKFSHATVEEVGEGE